MPARVFRQLSLAEFVAILDRFPFTRQIRTVHMHHTWRPNRAQYRGLASIEAMWRFHTQQNGWSDIAQHITIAPDGTIWTGRNWNLAPASATGHNGNAVAGPFMFEMIGDFDHGKDPFDGPQRDTVLQVIAHVQRRFDLPADALHFHNQMSAKTCPGSGIDYDRTVAEVKKIRAKLNARSLRPGPAPDAQRVEDGLRALLAVPIAARAARGLSEAAAEPAEEGMSTVELQQLTAPEGTSRELLPRPLSAADKKRLRPHVINLDQGQLSAGGAYQTARRDVEAIFNEHLEQHLAAATAAGRPLRVLFFAHGGLVSEQAGLKGALGSLPWWLANHVYPVYFVWETGLTGTLGALIRGAGSRELARGVSDVTDRLVEKAVGPLGGQLWKNMKDSAEWAHDATGGGRLAAEQLAAFCQRHAAELAAGRLELHAVGHSAGSIFHSYFVPQALELGVPAFRSLHLLAPAIRTDAFKQRLLPRLRQGIDALTVFTMHDQLEQADQCAYVYRKSLLYLVSNALETAPHEPLLGLEISLRADAALRQALGLDGAGAGAAEVVWSSTEEPTGRSSSTARAHGDFDNDPATMDSVLRRVLGTEPTTPFPRTRAVGAPDIWHEPVALPEPLVLLAHLQAEAQAPKGADITRLAQAAAAPPPTTSRRKGRRRALCIGIDAYASAPLLGCVADANAWAATLSQRGFKTETLLNEHATRAGILQAVHQLIAGSKAGDVLVLQYSGHGTTLPDLDGDELDGVDEALCPYDYDAGAYLLDDDLRQLFDALPAGVNLTCFFDCCHSGTITRMLGMTPAHTTPTPNQRVRYIPRTAQMADAHRAFRAAHATRSAAASRGPAAMREVTFTACRASELAYETDGSGDFTRRATTLLLAPDAAEVSHLAFQNLVRQAFGADPRQNPTLDCAPAARTARLLQPAAVPAKRRPAASK
ncbi:caspase family protein [Hymenobacter sp. 15J16-1T3B]|uniref:caspase family protein n=1 Tax=Hymenobacter sp. 15J16-1T3B TaxID=2886941 RepID=UPI001D0F4E3F|nr:caspase family protein [Hymenobacter sp. 15J16-1T3B]MCC3159008.1 caspase family protein [Hymenobacter sp. 15J16-1T3B]